MKVNRALDAFLDLKSLGIALDCYDHRVEAAGAGYEPVGDKAVSWNKPLVRKVYPSLHPFPFHWCSFGKIYRHLSTDQVLVIAWRQAVTGAN